MLDLDALDPCGASAPGTATGAAAASGADAGARAAVGGGGRPLQLDIALIDEDPAQPRREFDPAALKELAATVAERGVRQPVSVRRHPELRGRWMLNFGARRLRASRLAGLASIPAFVDETADSYDQVIENEQRQGLRPLELALFVQRRLAQGESQAEIARRVGRSRQWVTLATALIDAPAWLLQAYREGRCRGMAELYELRRLDAEHAGRVEAWLAECDNVTRDRLAAFRATLTAAQSMVGDHGPAGAVAATAVPPRADRQSLGAGGRPEPTLDAAGRPLPTPRAASPPTPAAQADRRVLVELEGELFALDVTAVPAKPGRMFVSALTGGPSRLVDAAALRLRGFAPPGQQPAR